MYTNKLLFAGAGQMVACGSTSRSDSHLECFYNDSIFGFLCPGVAREKAALGTKSRRSSPGGVRFCAATFNETL